MDFGISLPINEIREPLRKALASSTTRIVVEAPTGSGKSTQIPQFLLDDGLVEDGKEIVVLQPRRLAARMLARRVAQERNARLGDEVGYQVRFESAAGPKTRIRYVTEGVLLRQFLTAPTLPKVGAVIFDEFHERHFFGDVTLARCLDLQEAERPDLKLLVMSATLQTEGLKAYLGDECVHLKSEGRTFPVEIEYCPPRERHGSQLWDHIPRLIQEHFKSHDISGHTLIFMPGSYEIRNTIRALESASWTRAFKVLPLFGELPPTAQDEAVEPSDTPKIVVSTNVAETSLTIDGVRLVVDAGLARMSDFDVRRGIDTLTIQKISRASADQRAGRAGRTGPGTCLRLWSEEDHARRPAATPPEIHRMDLSEAVLTLKATGIEDVRGFRWFEAPESKALEQAIAWLIELDALDPETEVLTRKGEQLSKLPVNPRYGRILLEAAEKGCAEFFAVAIAATQTRPLFPTNRGRGGPNLTLGDYAHPGDVSDFQPLYRAWEAAKERNFDHRQCEPLGLRVGVAREIDRTVRQFLRIVGDLTGGKPQDREPDGEEVGRILLLGFPDRVARRLSDATLACAVVDHRRGLLDKNSVAAKSQLFIACEMTEVEGRDVTVRLGLATQIDEGWLRESFPREFSESAGAKWDPVSRRVEARVRRMFRDLVIEDRAGAAPPEDAAARILATEVREGRLAMKHWDHAVEQWIARLNTLAEAMPEYDLPRFGDEERQTVLEEICLGAKSYKEIKDRQVWPVLKDWLSPHQKGLMDAYVPERVTLSNGRQAKITYSSSGEKPKISVLIQNLFGVKETPTIAEGKIPLVIEILAPNHRPAQVTADLAGFWKNSYAAVRAQLRGRYPKHDWPEAV